MRSIFGTCSSEVLAFNGSLEHNSRVIFDRWKGQIGCYFELIAPYFDELAKRQSVVDIDALNVRVVISTEDLDSAVFICEVMLSDFANLDEQWRFRHGWMQSPGHVEREIVITLYRKRLLDVIRWMSMQFDNARRNHHCVVFGNGVFLRSLAGLPSDGIEVYS